MALNDKGSAASWKVDGITFAGILTTSLCFAQSGEFSRQGDVEAVMDGNGDTAAEAYFNNNKTLSMTVVPQHSHASLPVKATAAAALDGLLPEPGTVVTVADAGSNVTAQDHSGKYLVETAGWNGGNRSPRTATITCKQWDDNDISLDPGA